MVIVGVRREGTGSGYWRLDSLFGSCIRVGGWGRRSGPGAKFAIRNRFGLRGKTGFGMLRTEDEVSAMVAVAEEAFGGVRAGVVHVAFALAVNAVDAVLLEGMRASTVDAFGGFDSAVLRSVARLPASGALDEAWTVLPSFGGNAVSEHV